MLPWQVRLTLYHQYWTDNNQPSLRSRDTTMVQDNTQSALEMTIIMLLPLIRGSQTITTSSSTILLQRHIFSHRILSPNQEPALGLDLQLIGDYQSLCPNSTPVLDPSHTTIENRMSQAREVMTHRVRTLSESLLRITTRLRIGLMSSLRYCQTTSFFHRGTLL